MSGVTVRPNIGKKSIISKINKISKKIIKPVLGLMNKTQRSVPEGVQPEYKTLKEIPVWCADVGTEIDDNSSNEALEARLRELILSSPMNTKIHITGSFTLSPVTSEEDFVCPVHFGTFWTQADSDVCWRDYVPVTACQTAESQSPCDNHSISEDQPKHPCENNNITEDQSHSPCDNHPIPVNQTQTLCDYHTIPDYHIV